MLLVLAACLLTCSCCSSAPTVNAAESSPPARCRLSHSSGHSLSQPDSASVSIQAIPQGSDRQGSTCVPACMVSSLYSRRPLEGLLGPDPTQWVLRFGRQFLTTGSDPSQPPYVEGLGVADMQAAIRGYNRARGELGLSRVEGVYADRQEGESDSDHLSRIHGYILTSLLQEEPAILDLKSYVVRNREVDAKWEGLLGHAILVTGVGPLSSHGKTHAFVATGFDATSGQRLSVAIFCAMPHDFTVWRGSRYSGRWIPRAPVLRVEIPELALGRDHVEFSERTVSILSFVAWLPRSGRGADRSNDGQEVR